MFVYSHNFYNFPITLKKNKIKLYQQQQHYIQQDKDEYLNFPIDKMIHTNSLPHSDKKCLLFCKNIITQNYISKDRHIIM